MEKTVSTPTPIEPIESAAILYLGVVVYRESDLTQSVVIGLIGVGVNPLKRLPIESTSGWCFRCLPFRFKRRKKIIAGKRLNFAVYFFSRLYKTG